MELGPHVDNAVFVRLGVRVKSLVPANISRVTLEQNPPLDAEPSGDAVEDVSAFSEETAVEDLAEAESGSEAVVVEEFVATPPPNPWRHARSWEDLVDLAVMHHIEGDPEEMPGAPTTQRHVALPAEGVEAIEHLAQFGLFPLAVYPVAAETGGTVQRAAVTFLATLGAYSTLTKHLLSSPLLVMSDPDTIRTPITITNGEVVESIHKVPADLGDLFLDEWHPLLHRNAYRHFARARRVHVIDLDTSEPTRLWELLYAIPGHDDPADNPGESDTE